MDNKKYLPVWSDGLSYDEQHFVYWISNNMERINSNYSFLPIRIIGNFFCDRPKFEYIHIISDYFPEGGARVECEIIPLSYYVAGKAYDLAADEFFNQYPQALNVEFKKMNFNGVYDTDFAINYEERLNLFKKVLDEKIDELIVVDEEFEVKPFEESERWYPPDYSLKAKLDIKEKDLAYNFPQILASHGFPYVPKKQVRIKKEDIYEYYRTVPEKLFVLGNQYVKYNRNSIEYADFFDAAKKGDILAIRKYVESGVDINTIDSLGQTIFSRYINGYAGAFGIEETADIDMNILKEMIALGANPAIYGAGLDAEPLSEACLCRDIDVVDFLLKSGVNPHIYPCIDEPWSWGEETLLERTERWAFEEPETDSESDEELQKILEMLLQYA